MRRSIAVVCFIDNKSNFLKNFMNDYCSYIFVEAYVLISLTRAKNDLIESRKIEISRIKNVLKYRLTRLF